MSAEYILYIRNAGDAKAALSEAAHLKFIRECETYIQRLKSSRQLIAAQPLIREGILISKTGDQWHKTPIDPAKEVQVGYYHIVADSMEEAIEIAQQNPEFAFVPSATIEVRPVKTKEEKTNFNYPR